MIELFVWSFGQFLSSPLLLEPIALCGGIASLWAAWQLLKRVKG